MKAKGSTTAKLLVGATALLMLYAMNASAYDGQKCSEPGVCWEPKPGYPDKVSGSKYDPKHDPKEIAKQGNSEREMEARNKLRVEHFKKTGKFVYDVDKIPKQQ